MISPSLHVPPTPDHTLQVISAGASAALVLIIVVLLIRHGAVYNLAERLGHGFAGAAVFLSIFKQLGFARLFEPFNDWYQLLWRVGWLLLLGGKLWRMEVHRRRNEAMIQHAADHLAARAAQRLADQGIA